MGKYGNNILKLLNSSLHWFNVILFTYFCKYIMKWVVWQYMSSFVYQ